MVGDLFVFNSKITRSIEWLVEQEYPDECFLVPCDDSPLIGPADIELNIGRPLVARCNIACWASKQTMSNGLKCDSIPQAMNLVQNVFAKMARGQLDVTQEQRNTDCDPEYKNLIYDLCRARAEFIAKVGR